MNWRAIAIGLSLATSQAHASAWEIYALCSDRAVATTAMVDQLQAKDWAQFDPQTFRNATLDPDDATDLALIYQVVRRHFATDPDHTTEAELQAEIDHTLKYAFSHVSEGISHWTNGTSILAIAADDVRRECDYFGPSHPSDSRFPERIIDGGTETSRYVFFRVEPLNAHFGSVVFAPSAELATYLGVEMADHILMNVNLNLPP